MGYHDVLLDINSIEDYWVRARFNMGSRKLTFEVNNNENDFKWKATCDYNFSDGGDFCKFRMIRGDDTVYETMTATREL